MNIHGLTHTLLHLSVLRTDILWAIHFQSIFFFQCWLWPCTSCWSWSRNPEWVDSATKASNSSHLKRWNKSMNHFQGYLLLVFQTLALSPGTHFIWTVFPNCLDGWVPPGKGTCHVPDRNQRRACGAKRLAIADAWCVSEFSPRRGGNQWGFP